MITSLKQDVADFERQNSVQKKRINVLERQVETLKRRLSDAMLEH